VRKWKRPKEFGEAQWEFEIGEQAKAFDPEADLLAPSGENVKRCHSEHIADIHSKRHSRALRMANQEP